MWLLYVVRGLQVLSVVLGLLGGGNAMMTGAKVFGAGEPTGFDLLATLGPMVGAALSWAGSHFLGWKLTAPTILELLAAAAAYGRARTEENKLRLIVAIIPLAKELVGSLEALVTISKAIDSVNLVRVSPPTNPGS